MPEKKLTRVLFSSDVHGSEKTFMKLLNAAKMYQANVLILSGDLTGKALIPIVRDGDIFSADVLGRILTARTAQDLAELEKDLRSVGYYYFASTKDEVERLRNDKAEVDRLFAKLIDDRIRRWIGLAEDRLSGTDIRCYISPGNDDRFSIDQILSSSGFVVNPEDRLVKIDDYHEMITLGWSNPTPWNSQRECSEDVMRKKIESLVSKVENIDDSIFNFHCPPYNSNLDMAPKVQGDLEASAQMIPVGSTAVREAIEEHKPLLGLHGHVHESRGRVKIGRTWCFNPGSEYTEGILRAYLINLDQKSVKSYQSVSG